jgi:signal transduction histidine kinase
MPERLATIILIIEDSPTQAEQLRHVLEEDGYRTIVAKNAEVALECIRRQPPDIIVSDIIMPGMDGFSLCRKIKSEINKALPVILLTALSDPADVLKGLECGADHFITKPYKDAYLLRRIRAVYTTSHMRFPSETDSGVEISFRGRTYAITSERGQILDLLISTYEMAILKNEQLKETQLKLEEWNDQLEKTVQERTAKLVAEIRERKRAEAEVRILNSELEQRVEARTAELEAANRELETFAYSVSHDLRAPLRTIEAFSAALEDRKEIALDDTGRDYLRRVRASAKNMSQLIDALLNLSRIGREEMRCVTVDLSALVRNAADELSGTTPDREIDLMITEGLTAQGDPAMLKVVIGNLMENAWKFTALTSRARIEFGAVRENGKTVYFVRDNGSGFDMAYSATMFMPFHRLHGATEFPGIGVGLATVERIIHRHGGTIWAEGEVDKGATLSFTLN